MLAATSSALSALAIRRHSCELHGDGGDTEFGYPSPPELQAACGADRTFCSASGPSTSHCSSRTESCSFGKAATRTAGNALRTLWTIGCNSAALGTKYCSTMLYNTWLHCSLALQPVAFLRSAKKSGTESHAQHAAAKQLGPRRLSLACCPMFIAQQVTFTPPRC